VKTLNPYPAKVENIVSS